MKAPLRILLVLLAMLTALTSALAQDSPRDRLTSLKKRLDRVAVALERPGLAAENLTALRAEIDPVRTDLIALQADVAGPREAAKVRVEKLGPPPKEGEPPEAPEVSEARKRENASFAELDSVAREAELEVTRADQTVDRINQIERRLVTAVITARELSTLNPEFWIQIFEEMPRAGLLVLNLGEDTISAARREVGWETGGAFLIIVAGLIFARLIRRRFENLRTSFAASNIAPRRFIAASDVLLEIVSGLLRFPLYALIVFFGLDAVDLLLERFGDIIAGPFVAALIVSTAYDRLGAGILAVKNAHLRLLPLSDWAVRRIRRRVRWSAYVIFFNSWLLSVLGDLFAPVSLTTGVRVLSTVILGVVIISLLVRLRAAPLTPQEVESGGATTNPLDFLRPILWLVVIAMFGCLIAGYVSLASLICFLVPIALAIITLAYVAITLIDSGLTDGLAVDGARGRAVANAIGVSPRNVAFAATLLSGILRFFIIISVAIIFTTGLGIVSVDFFSTLERAFFGFQVGEITIAPSSILYAIALLIGVLVITRLISRWVRNTLMPRTTLDAGLQNSIVTVIGYIGAVLAIVVALSEVGLDLQNFAIVAGALSVGIGFGLQSIVSNFVSGLILLAERPVRVGDIVSVKNGEEGYVRRISVRATEIETYDRATLIVPNSELITGVVKNWIYGNSWARTRVTVRVGYDVDVDDVQRRMLEAVADDPRILPSPRPRVFLNNLGDSALEFELVAVLASVETAPAVKSDLHMRIVKSFRAGGIRMAAQLPAAPPPVVVSLQEALAATSSPKPGNETNAG